MSPNEAQLVRYLAEEKEYLRRIDVERRTERALAAEDLVGRLEALPHRFDFFQAVRRWDAYSAFRNLRFARVGYSTHRHEEALHFGQEPFLVFAPRAIQRCSWQPVPTCRFPKCPVMLVYLFGLFGPNAPLPRYLTEFAQQRQRRKDFAFTNFINLLQHRFLSYFYRSWATLNPVTELDRPGPRPFARVLGSLAGVPGAGPGESATSNRFAGVGAGDVTANPDGEASPTASRSRDLDEWPLLFLAGRFAGETRSAEGLEGILRTYFDADAQVQTFTGRWLNLDAAERTRLGRGATELGQSTILGDRVWDCQTAFRIRLGPRLGPATLTLEQVTDFAGLATRLAQPKDHLGRYLAARLSPMARREISNWAAGEEVPSPLRNSLLDSLNAVIRGYLIWDPERFAGVRLREEVRELLHTLPASDRNTARLNRLLLEDAFPLELARRSGLSRFRHFLPGAPGAVRLRRWVADYVGWEFDWDLEVVLHREDVPDLKLDGSAQLGWTAFLKTRPPSRDVGGILFSMLKSGPPLRHG